MVSAELATIISYPTSASGIIVLLKTMKKYCKLWLVSLSKNNQKTILMVAILRHRYNGSYTMASKPIKFLELHYTIIQLLIILNRLYIMLSGQTRLLLVEILFL